MDNNQEQPKKCFCARCFLPIDDNDKVDVEGQHFHRFCSVCCVCRTIPTSLKLFYGHVFCNECFKTHVLTRFRGETPRVNCNTWWMQFGSGEKPKEHDADSEKTSNKSEESTKRCVCSRCLQLVSDGNKVDIGGQSFHAQCARCCSCHQVPKDSVKIYYGQVFCEECFQRHVMNSNRDNPGEFFKNCFDQWQNNAQFAESMREFMAGNKEALPFVFMMPDGQTPFCRCGTSQQEWSQPNEPRKSANFEMSGSDYSYSVTPSENLPDDSNQREAESIKVAAEKIAKLTKYLHSVEGSVWMFPGRGQSEGEEGAECPFCLWQCGYVCARPQCFGDCLLNTNV